MVRRPRSPDAHGLRVAEHGIAVENFREKVGKAYLSRMLT